MVYGSNNWANRFSIEEQIGTLTSTNMVKKFKNPNSHIKTKIYRVIPLQYERSNWGGNSLNPFRVFELPKLFPTNISFWLVYRWVGLQDGK